MAAKRFLVSCVMVVPPSFPRSRLSLGPELAVDAGEASGEGGDGVGVAGAHDDLHGEVLEGDVGPGDGRAAGGLERLGDADGIDQDVAGLGGLGGGGDFFQRVVVEGAGAAAFHLLEVALRLHVAHEEEAFEGLHVGAGGDHVHGDGDARVVGVAEVGEDGLGVLLALVGDLFAEAVPLVELLADDLDDVVGVGVGLGEDERLGDLDSPSVSARSGKISGSLSRKVRMMVRIWEGLTISPSSFLAEYALSSSCCSQRLARVSFSRFSTRPLRTLPPCCVTSVSMSRFRPGR